MKNIVGRSFLTLLDFTPEEIQALIDYSLHFKKLKQAGTKHNFCAGNNIALIFEKTSTRTRCSFEVAAYDLGINVTYLDSSVSQIGNKESIRDTARVLGGIYDGIEYRGSSQKTVEELARFSGVPVWNGLTDEFHPTQVLADLMTILEVKGKLQGTKLVYLGDGRFNMGRSLLIGGAKMGLHLVISSPADYFPDQELINKAHEIAKETNAILEFETDPIIATKNADFIYTDVWLSMGEPEAAWAERIEMFLPYQVNQKIMENAGPNASFLHCLPAYHDLNTTIGQKIFAEFGLEAMEVTNEVFESQNSLVFQQAENRMHTIKALMAAILRDQ